VNHFCTITTQSHLYKAHALAESINKQPGEPILHILIVDSETIGSPQKNCKYWKLSEISLSESARKIIEKYKSNKDKLRWSLKPVFLKHLLEKQAINSVIYLDNDVFFYSDYRFIFDLLSLHSFLLTPHYYKNDPRSEQNWFEANFRVGLYNAGFIGVNGTAKNTLQWWAECCIYRCEKNSFRGLFDDQKYLDLIPVMEETAFIMRHQGCNVAGWNTELCRREVINNEIRINGKFPIVFIHFNDTTIREVVKGKDKILLPFYREYFETLRKYNSDLREDDLLFAQPWSDKVKLNIWKFFTELGS
jgi:hypothetical protein